MRRFARWWPLAVVALLASCAENAPQDTLEPEGPTARTIDNLITPVFWVAGLVFVLILGGSIYVAFRFRARGDDDFDEIPKQIHGNIRLELFWTALPFLILFVISIFTVLTIFDLAGEADEDALEVQVVGQQWWWEYRYDLNGNGRYDDPEDITTANDLVIPEDREVDLTITSRDVIHSFWAPKLNGKKDAVPNREHPLVLEADEPGEYLGQCTEYCGLSHADMRIKVIALTAEGYERWERNQLRDAGSQPTDELAAAGYDLFNQQLCSSCHLIEGVNDDKVPDGEIEDPNLQVSRHAPNLTHLMSRTTFAGAIFDLRRNTPACREQGVDWDPDECLNVADLEAWLRNPEEQKDMAVVEEPSTRTATRGMPDLDLTEEQIDQLVAYLRTLK